MHTELGTCPGVVRPGPASQQKRTVLPVDKHPGGSGGGVSHGHVRLSQGNPILNRLPNASLQACPRRSLCKGRRLQFHQTAGLLGCRTVRMRWIALLVDLVCRNFTPESSLRSRIVCSWRLTSLTPAMLRSRAGLTELIRRTRATQIQAFAGHSTQSRPAHPAVNSTVRSVRAKHLQ